MTSLNGSVETQMRSPWSFMGSVCLHTWVLAWVALAPAIPSELKNPLAQREFPLQDQHIVWYKLSDRLPNVTPPQGKHDVRPLRARAKFEQNIVAGPKDTDRPPQVIFAPAPEITPAKPLPLPNIVAVAERPPALPFTAPPVKPLDRQRTPALPDAPKVGAAALDAGVLPIKVSGPQAPRFIPPKNPKLPFGSSEPATLPAAPAVGSAAPDLSAPLSLPRQQAKFVPPAAHGATAAAEEGPSSISAPPPVLTANAAVPAGESLVIAGLDPAKSTEVPSPPGSMKGGFSGGPKPQPAGGEGTPSGATLEIPSLTIQGGAKNPQPPIMVASVSATSPEGLAAALRAAPRGGFPAEGSAHGAVRATRAPDPRMYGRQVYTMAVQIPNLTSYSGSWVIWFASRQTDLENAAVDLRPPLPLHMVSPRYIHSAQEDRVQGKVRLWAVIGTDGHVSDISLLLHLDDRLDASAEEALGKWLFQPAERNGSPIDVFAVFEIPFTLAPKPAR